MARRTTRRKPKAKPSPGWYFAAKTKLWPFPGIVRQLPDDAEEALKFFDELCSGYDLRFREDFGVEYVTGDGEVKTVLDRAQIIGQIPVPETFTIDVDMSGQKHPCIRIYHPMEGWEGRERYVLSVPVADFPLGFTRGANVKERERGSRWST
jgi:hypothetical protein